MSSLKTLFIATDVRLTNWMSRHGLTLLRVSLGIVFLWFGVIKFVPGLSAADELATRTILTLTFGSVPPDISRPLLAAWETLIGLGLLSGVWMRATLLLLFAQMLGTVTPLALFPAETWRVFPIAPTLEGQYILKNLVLVTAGLVIGATVRGGAVVANPDAAQEALAKQRAEEQALG